MDHTSLIETIRIWLEQHVMHRSTLILVLSREEETISNLLDMSSCTSYAVLSLGRISRRTPRKTSTNVSWRRNCPRPSKCSAKDSLRSSWNIWLIAEIFDSMRSQITITASNSSRRDSRRKRMRKTAILTGIKSQRRERQNKLPVLLFNSKPLKIKLKFK